MCVRKPSLYIIFVCITDRTKCVLENLAYTLFVSVLLTGLCGLNDGLKVSSTIMVLCNYEKHTTFRKGPL